MVSTGKLLILATVGGVALILGTVALGLTLLLNQRTALQQKNKAPNPKTPENAAPVLEDQRYQTSLDINHYNQKLNRYKTFASDPTSTVLSSEAHFKLALELFGDNFPLGEFEEKEVSPFVGYTADSPSADSVSSYKTTVSDLKSLSLSSLVRWCTSYVSAAKARIERSASRRRQQERRKRRGRRDVMEELAWEHLIKAAELGYPDAQYILGNAYVSGMFWGGQATSSMSNGGRNVSLGLANWHMAAIGGSIEAAVNLGNRYLSTDEKDENEGYGVTVPHGEQCKMAKAYYEEAAHGIIDVLESGPSRGKVTPAVDKHRLYEVFIAGAASKLASYNKPDELQEALEYYKLRASNVDSSTSKSSIDVHAALTLAQFHHYGIKGVWQDLNQALKYYEIAGGAGSREAAGQAGMFHFFGIGYDNYENITSFASFGDRSQSSKTPLDETLHPIKFGNLYKAYEYLSKATSTIGIEDCYRRKPRGRSMGDDGSCDSEGLNGMGLLHLFGLPGVIRKNRELAIRYFQLAKESQNMDANFHLAMIYMGWMKQPPLGDDQGDNVRVNRVDERTNNIRDEVYDDSEHTINPMQSISLGDMAFLDEDGNQMTFDDMVEMLGPEGVNMVNQLHNQVQLNNMDIPEDVDNAVIIEDGENLPPQVRALMQNIALAAAKGAGKADGIEGELSDGLGYKIKTQLIYPNNHRHNPTPSTNSQPTKADYQHAVNHLELAAKSGHVQASHRLATIYSHGIPSPNHPGSYLVQPNCQSSLRLFRQVVEHSPYVSLRSRRAYKQYMAGDATSSLLNYLVLAEGGSEIGQLNAAWLLEQGYCLNMSKRNCLRASLRMWKAAAHQGSSEATLRVGDFYYYGKMYVAEQSEPQGKNDDIYENELWYNKLYRWILYPEQMMKEGRVCLIKYMKQVLNSRKKDIPPSQSCIATDDKTCPAEEIPPEQPKKIIETDMETAAKYYRLAAEGSGSWNQRANYNLGYMHEWGLGLKQDFPLAKRHYDLARSTNTAVVVQMALFSMNVHHKIHNLKNFLTRWWKELDDEVNNNLLDEDASIMKQAGYRLKYVIHKYVPKTYHPRWKVIMSHMVVLDWEMFGIICLSLVLIKFLMTLRQRRG